MRRNRLAAPALVLAAGLLGCSGSHERQLRVSAAASLRRAFVQYAAQLRGITVRYSFAGSDALAAQIEHGGRPDVFASADTKLPRELFAEGLVERPVEFAANQLVLAIPVHSRMAALADLERPGVTVAVGTSTVPVGAYTASVLSRLPATQRDALERNIRDREPDVTGIVAKLAEAAVEAGFVYRTDVLARRGRLRAIALPKAVRPQVGYAAAVVRGSPERAAARSFVTGLLHGAARADLREDGFLPPVRN